jgi:uncharacterized membrane protein
LKLTYNLDLALAIIFSLLLIPAVVFTDWMAVRIILGVPFLLFIPGYALMAAFFPGKTRLGKVERLAYSMALSIVLVILDGLLLNYVWSVDVYPLLITLESLALLLLAIAWLRRRNLPQEDRIIFEYADRQPLVASIDKFLIALLVVSIIGAGITAVYTGIKNAQPYSELYLLGEQGKAADYPQELSAGEEGRITLVLTNHEKQDISYTIDIVLEDGHALIDGMEQDEIEVTLENGQERSYEVTFGFDTAGEGKKIEFDLYKNGNDELYLSTYLRVDVTN